MSEFKVDAITNRDGSYGPEVCGVTTFTSSGLTLPSGPTEFRKQNGIGRGMACIAGAQNSTVTINKVEIQTKGDATDFGDLTQGREMGAGFGSATRGVFMGGRLQPGDAVTTIDFVTLSSGGGADDFGNLENATTFLEGCSNQVRGVSMGGYNGTIRVVDITFVTIATTGDSTEFGSLSAAAASQTASCSSPTRGIVALANAPSISSEVNIIEFITFATRGDAQDFGDLTLARRTSTSTSSDTRGLICGSEAPVSTTIDYITIATKGDAIDFGDLTDARGEFASASDNVRGICAGGNSAPARVNIIDFFTIPSTGDAADFGDMTYNSSGHMGTGDNHGGLQS